MVGYAAFWDKLTEEEKADMARSTVVQQAAKGSVFHSCGDDCMGAFLVQKGVVRTYLLSEEGKEVTLFYMRAGEICVLSAACVVRQLSFDTQMTAEEDCQLLVLSAGAVSRLMEQNIYARCYFYEMVAERFSAVVGSIQQILFMRVDHRLADFLLEEHTRTGRIEIRMTHEQIARQISTAREVVARTLKRFSNDGLVEVRRGSIRLLNLAGLTRLKQ